MGIIQVSNRTKERQVRLNRKEIIFLLKYSEDRIWVLDKSRRLIIELLEQLADYEQELYEKDSKIKELEFHVSKLGEKQERTVVQELYTK